MDGRWEALGVQGVESTERRGGDSEVVGGRGLSAKRAAIFNQP